MHEMGDALQLDAPGRDVKVGFGHRNDEGRRFVTGSGRDCQ